VQLNQLARMEQIVGGPAGEQLPSANGKTRWMVKGVAPSRIDQVL
jgi:hypothetical protein